MGYLGLEDPPGDVHIKYGYIEGDSYYVIKIASGFYDNPKLGLATGNGMMLTFDAKTGAPVCFLLDEGYLTDLRTGLAGAVAAKYLAPKETSRIGIVGTGVQARFQLRCLSYVNDCKDVLVYGRSADKRQLYKSEMTELGFHVEATDDLRAIARGCDLIVTTTPSKTALLMAEDIRPGTHITAMGADADGKQELDERILQKADLVVCDSLTQCIDHGELFHAIEAGLVQGEDCLEMGQWMQSGRPRTDAMITVADLTGIATQDIAITSLVLTCSLEA